MIFVISPFLGLSRTLGRFFRSQKPSETDPGVVEARLGTFRPLQAVLRCLEGAGQEGSNHHLGVENRDFRNFAVFGPGQVGSFSLVFRI